MSYIQGVLEEIKEDDGYNVSQSHLFNEFLKYEGIIGYDRMIKAAIKEIYNVDLDKEGE